MLTGFELALGTAIWAIASAAAVCLVGVFSLMGGRSRPRGAFAFGLFCLLWGAQVLLFALAGVIGSPRAAETLYFLGRASVLLTPFLLTEFAISQVGSTRVPLAVSLFRWLALGSATLGAAIFLLDPSLISQGVTRQGGLNFENRGPLATWFVALHFAAFGLTLWALRIGMSHAPTGRTATRAATLLAGLGIYAGYASTNNLIVYASLVASGYATFESLLYALIFAGLTAACATTVWRKWAVVRRLPADASRAHRLVAGALVVSMAAGVLEASIVTIVPEWANFETVGLWRLAGLAVIAYGLARWRFYDLPQRTARAAATASGATAATVSAAAAAGATTLASNQTAVPIVAGLLVLGASILPSVRFARRLFGVTDVRTQKADDQLYGQRIDAYRAALEASLARDSLDEDREFLAALRERFAITDAEERVLLHYARSSVIVARSDKAFDAFERLRLLGEGGGGRTWLARDRARDRLVVLKEPLDKHHADPAMRENVLREARLAARVRHPNVVNVEQVVESKGMPVIVMEYLEGGSLADVLRARGTLPWREAVEMTLGVLRGVEAVHAAGIIHRDVKPSNVLIGSEGAPKVADFGVAVPASGGATIVEGSSTFAGTLSYLAPEVRFRGQTADRRSDVYSCAVLLHECLHGAPPGRTAVVVQNDVPGAVSAALARGLADDPDARFQTARAFGEELARLLR